MKKCDLVMKGGITSGIVYPGAVAELAKEYEFVNIGGTSAGAIAAAVTAAAEYGRKSGKNANAFAGVKALSGWLAGSEGGRSRLLQLFQPSAATKPLFDLAIAWLETKNLVKVVRKLLATFATYAGPAFVIGLGAAAIAGVAAWKTPSLLLGILLLVVALALLALGGVAAVVASVGEAAKYAWDVLPREQFGMCNGATHERGPVPGLTQWLHEKIMELAGVNDALTCGDLESVGVHLEMMTTNLTWGRPHRLPFEQNHFFFDAAELRRLFPEAVVQRMIGSAAPNADGLYPFPDAANLPIVVAARMSLSFPVLLTALPLRAYDYGRKWPAGTPRQPEVCWFSDGGISSNFPVHFFDAPIPRWPTFAINLDNWTKRYHDDGQRVYVPDSNRSGIVARWRSVTSLVSFFGAIVNTMQNWRDNMLLHVPGQRDRIAHVLLLGDEGGLNLTMDETQMTSLASRGAEAAQILGARFGDHPPAGTKLTWTNHKWVRFLSFMGALQRSFASIDNAFVDADVPRYPDLVCGSEPPPSYDSAKTQAMCAAVTDFAKHIHEDFAQQPFVKENLPKPPLDLRAMPRE
ncbi:MAG: patatin-like phospholipase family protein [Acidobacteria bacterium]|nr:patatin-like phospholipase family protein [Acidobacteriota bacterium]MBV9477121.1 patatin-like phospholipase family protein [Acidobacteriota bacterium]